MTAEDRAKRSEQLRRRAQELAKKTSDVVEREVMPTVSDIYSYPHRPSRGTGPRPEKGHGA